MTPDVARVQTFRVIPVTTRSVPLTVVILYVICEVLPSNVAGEMPEKINKKP